MSRVRRIFSVATDGHAYLNLGYVLLRLPMAVAYASILGFIFFRGLQDLWTLILLVPGGMAIWGAVVTERAMARSWFGARLTPMAPERPHDRTWRQRMLDLISNPVTWKSLAFVVVEAVVGFGVGLFALVGLTLGAVGTIALVMTFLVTVLVTIFAGDAAAVPLPLPFASLGGSVVCLAVFLLTLHAAGWIARLQLWFVRVMLGMSETQAALAAARAEAAAERARAENADRSRRDLVLNVSHELRNPLATIRAHVDTLRGDGTKEPPEKDRRRYLEVLNRETDRLASLVDELLALASADGGGLHLSR